MEIERLGMSYMLYVVRCSLPVVRYPLSRGDWTAKGPAFMTWV